MRSTLVVAISCVCLCLAGSLASGGATPRKHRTHGPFVDPDEVTAQDLANTPQFKAGENLDLTRKEGGRSIERPKGRHNERALEGTVLSTTKPDHYPCRYTRHERGMFDALVQDTNKSGRNMLSGPSQLSSMDSYPGSPKQTTPMQRFRTVQDHLNQLNQRWS